MGNSDHGSTYLIGLALQETQPPQGSGFRVSGLELRAAQVHICRPSQHLPNVGSEGVNSLWGQLPVGHFSIRSPTGS